MSERSIKVGENYFRIKERDCDTCGQLDDSIGYCVLFNRELEKGNAPLKQCISHDLELSVEMV